MTVANTIPYGPVGPAPVRRSVAATLALTAAALAPPACRPPAPRPEPPSARYPHHHDTQGNVYVSGRDGRLYVVDEKRQFLDAFAPPPAEAAAQPIAPLAAACSRFFGDDLRFMEAGGEPGYDLVAAWHAAWSEHEACPPFPPTTLAVTLAVASDGDEYLAICSRKTGRAVAYALRPDGNVMVMAWRTVETGSTPTAPSAP